VGAEKAELIHEHERQRTDIESLAHRTPAVMAGRRNSGRRAQMPIDVLSPESPSDDTSPALLTQAMNVLNDIEREGDSELQLETEGGPEGESKGDTGAVRSEREVLDVYEGGRASESGRPRARARG
jgi:hypothetical protein